MSLTIESIKTEVEVIKKDIINFDKIFSQLDKTNDNMESLVFNIKEMINLHDKKLSISEIEIANTKSTLEILKKLNDDVRKLTDEHFSTNRRLIEEHDKNISLISNRFGKYKKNFR